MVISAYLLLPLANTLLAIAPATARDAKYQFDIPAGPISGSLATLSQRTGISIGYAGNLPALRARAVHGRMTPAKALSRLLEGTGFFALQISPGAFRIQAMAKPLHPKASPVSSLASASPDPVANDIIITGQKRPQILSQVPMSITVVSLDSVTNRASLDSRDIALSIEGLALTNLGPGRNRQFIRGVADSPFIGASQSTVAVQVDNARVTFDAPDPDLRLIDVERVEVLKGPQGPLYGSGALGGIYHIVTRKPVLDTVSASTRLIGETIAHGGPGIGGEAVLNLPIITDKLGLRAAGYASHGGGWIDNIGRQDNANVSSTYGGRLALRWQPSAQWTIDVTGIVQNINVADSQYVTASGDTLGRVSRIAEPTDNDFRAASVTVTGQVGRFDLVSATSYVDHRIDFTLDASASAAKLGVTAPSTFHDDRAYSVLNQEVRVSPTGSSSRWLAGVSFLRATSRSDASLSEPTAAPMAVESLSRVVTEYAIFGEATLPLARRINATAGLRLFRTMEENEASERIGGTSGSVGKTVLSPSLAVSWAPQADTIVFLRYARSIRPGGLAPAGSTVARRFDADTLWTVDLGFRHVPSGGSLRYNVSVFHTRWNNIQSDYLLPNGLVSTRNAGRGHIVGAEASLDWTFLPTTRLSAGLTVQNGQLVRNEAGVPISDPDLPVTPHVTARIAMSQDFTLAGWQSSANAQLNFTGRAHLTFDPDIDRTMGRYATMATGLSFSKNAMTFGFRIENLFDAHGDSFAFGNQFSIRATNQYVPLRPRTLTVSVGRAF